MFIGDGLQGSVSPAEIITVVRSLWRFINNVCSSADCVDLLPKHFSCCWLMCTEWDTAVWTKDKDKSPWCFSQTSEVAAFLPLSLICAAYLHSQAPACLIILLWVQTFIRAEAVTVQQFREKLLIRRPLKGRLQLISASGSSGRDVSHKASLFKVFFEPSDGVLLRDWGGAFQRKCKGLSLSQELSVFPLVFFFSNWRKKRCRRSVLISICLQR